MKFFHSIVNRFFFTAGLIILFWMWAGLSFVDHINRIFYFTRVNGELSTITELAGNIERGTMRLQKTVFYDDASSDPEIIRQSGMEIVTFLNGLERENGIRQNASARRRIRMIGENITDLQQSVNEYLRLLREKGNLSTGLIRKIREGINVWGPSGNERFDAFIAGINREYGLYLVSMDPRIPEAILSNWDLDKSLITRSMRPSVIYRGASLDRTTAEGELENQILLFRDLMNIDRKLGNYDHNGLSSELSSYSGQIRNNLKSLSSEYRLYTEKKSRFLAWSPLYLFIFGGMLLFTFLWFFSKSTAGSFSSIKDSIIRLGKGMLPEKIEGIRETEFVELAGEINDYTESLKKKIEFSKTIGEDNPGEVTADFTPGDVLGDALNKLAGKLALAREEDRAHKEEEEKRRWTSEGLAKFGDLFRSEREDTDELAFLVIRNLVGYLGAGLGSIYILDDEDAERPSYRMAATFAYDRRKFLKDVIFPGEGLIGTCILEKETIFLTDIPGDYIEISSGLGETPPRCLLIVPLKIENNVFGIIEMASFTILKEHEIRFAEILGESVAASLASVRINEKTNRLLVQSREQATEMALQEEKMRKNMNDLQQAQEESRRREAEMDGILMAVKTSSLVAEFTVNGRFADINDKFILLLDSPRESIIGSHHSDFAVADKYSVEYKKLWNDLKEGKTISLTERFRLFNGNEVWLKVTYSPIPDQDNKTRKILAIATDITRSVQQQAALEEQAGEIARKNYEMNSLSEAIDLSLIKSEYSPEGIILSVNDNYAGITGYSKKELLGKNTRLFLKETEKEQFDNILGEVMKGKVYSGVIRRTRPTGEECWLMASFTPAADEGGNTWKIICIAQDITEKKLRYQLLEEANREIERLKSQFNNS